MKIACLIPLTLLFVTSHAAAVDLTQVSRTIGDEPEYRTQPKYALLVVGPGAATRVWLVHDGDTLYADLNGDCMAVEVSGSPHCKSGRAILWLQGSAMIQTSPFNWERV